MDLTLGRSRTGTLSERSPFRHVDPILLATAFALSVVGLFAIYAASHTSAQQVAAGTVKRQVAALVVAVVAMALAALIDYRTVKIYAGFVYAGMLVLLLLVRSPLGHAAKGAQRAFSLGGFEFTPSELMKVALIVMLAAVLADLKRQDLRLREVTRAVVIAALPMFLVFIQPDIGTTIVLAAILVGVVIVAGARFRHLGVLALLAAALLAGAFRLGVIKQYQIARVVGFLDPKTASSANYNQNQSVIAVGAGGLHGEGWLKGLSTNLDYVPEQHTDFIFTVVGEEFGFVGSAVLLALYALLLWRAIRIAQMSKDAFGTYLAAGIAMMFAVQMFVNIGMTIGIMPITGIPLPFVSYGGSSLIANFIAVGLLQNVHMRRAV